MTSGKRRFARADILGKTIHWLADVTIGGRVYHWSTRDLDVTGDDGVIHYDGCLDEISFRESMDLLEITNPARVTLTAQVENAAELLRAGRDLRQSAELSRWAEGTTYESRVPKLVGFLRDPVISENAIEVAIDTDPFNDTGSIPERTAIVDSSAWNKTYLASSDLDLPYPTIIGKPGRSRMDFDGQFAGSPARWVSKQNQVWKLLIAGHEVEATQVFLSHDDFPSGRRFVVTHEVDSRGRVVAVVASDASGSGAAPVTDDLAANPNDKYYPDLESPTDADEVAALNPAVATASEIWVGWYDLTSTGAGRGVKVNGVAIREAGDVLRYVLGFSTLTLDDGAWTAAAPYLSQFKIDCVINECVTPWEWITSMLLPLLPLSIVPGPWGVRPIVLRWGATADDAVAHLDDTNGAVEFADSIEVDASRIANKFTMKYGYDWRSESYRYTCRRSGAYEDSTAYAVGRLVADNGASDPPTIEITSTTPGQAGAYRVTLSGAGGGEISSYVGSTNTVSVAFDDGVSTTALLTAAIIAGAAELDCESSTSGTTWQATHPANVDQTLLLDDEGTAGDYRCAVSQSRYRTDSKPTGEIEEATESPLVYESNTANAVLEWRAAVYALEHHRVIVVGDANEWEWLQLGAVVTLTSTRLALTEEVAHVESLEIHDDGRLYIGCLILDDPLRHGYIA